MKITLLAAAAAMGLSIAPAFAAENSGYTYPDFWGTEAVQQAPIVKAPVQSNGAAVGVYPTLSSQGTWLFSPNPNSGANG